MDKKDTTILKESVIEKLASMIEDNLKELDNAINSENWRDAAFYTQLVLKQALNLDFTIHNITDLHCLYGITSLADMDWKHGLRIMDKLDIGTGLGITPSQLVYWEEAEKDADFTAIKPQIIKYAKIAKEYFETIKSEHNNT